MTCDLLSAPFHEGSNGCWSRIQLGNCVSSDDFPEAIFRPGRLLADSAVDARRIRRSFVHH